MIQIVSTSASASSQRKPMKNRVESLERLQSVEVEGKAGFKKSYTKIDLYGPGLPVYCPAFSVSAGKNWERSLGDEMPPAINVPLMTSAGV